MPMKSPRHAFDPDRFPGEIEHDPGPMALAREPLVIPGHEPGVRRFVVRQAGRSSKQRTGIHQLDPGVRCPALSSGCVDGHLLPPIFYRPLSVEGTTVSGSDALMSSPGVVRGPWSEAEPRPAVLEIPARLTALEFGQVIDIRGIQYSLRRSPLSPGLRRPRSPANCWLTRDAAP